MGVYIKGMEMPENCALCKFRGVGETWCPFTWQEVPGNTIPEDCPLVPVPEHGRLIDADALMKHKGDCYDSDGHLLYAVGTGTIMRMPTIIPADKEGEG